MSTQFFFPPLPGYGDNALAIYQKPKSYQVLASHPTLPFPANTLSLATFKTYINIVSQADTSLDGRINLILVSVLKYFETKSNYSIYNTQYRANLTIATWTGIEFDKKLISQIVSIQYKASDYNQTQVLTTLPLTFQYQGQTLSVFTLAENGNRKCLLQFNPLFDIPSFYVDEDNLQIIFNVNQFTIPGDLEFAMYQHALNQFTGCFSIPDTTLDVYSSYFGSSGTQESSLGLSII